MRVVSLVVLIASAAVFESNRGAGAMEGGQSPYLKGYRDFLSGVLPEPGVQVREDAYLYSGKDSSRIPAGQLTAGLHTFSNILGVTAVTPLKVLGGDYGFALRAAVTRSSADRAVAAGVRTTRTDDQLTGFNDVVVTPLVLGWHAGNWHWNVATTVWLPVGSYDMSRLVNTGRNFWSWSPQFALTYLDRAAGLEFSGALSYVSNYENTATHYKSGDVLHLDLVAMKGVAPRLSVGAVGYAMQQVTADGGSGNTLGDRKAQVLGFGPAVTYIVGDGKVPVMLTAKYYREFSGQNTTQGDSGSISMRVHF